MAASLIAFMVYCWTWCPLEIIGIFMLLVWIQFGDALLGVFDRGWRVVGR